MTKFTFGGAGVRYYGNVIQEIEFYTSGWKHVFVCLFVCLSGRLQRRKESGCPIGDSASCPGVGIGNTSYQVLPVEFRHMPGLEQTFLTPRPVQS